MATAIQLSAVAFSILDDRNESIETFDLFEDETDQAVAALSSAFGFEPLVGTLDTTPHGAIRTTYTWDGFQLQDTMSEPSYPDVSAYFIVVTSASVGGLAVHGVDQAAVGGTGASLAGVAHWTNGPGAGENRTLLLDQTLVEGIAFADYEPAALSLRVWVDPATDTIYRLDAPTRNWGA